MGIKETEPRGNSSRRDIGCSSQESEQAEGVAVLATNRRPHRLCFFLLCHVMKFDILNLFLSGCKVSCTNICCVRLLWAEHWSFTSVSVHPKVRVMIHVDLKLYSILTTINKQGLCYHLNVLISSESTEKLSKSTETDSELEIIDESLSQWGLSLSH